MWASYDLKRGIDNVTPLHDMIGKCWQKKDQLKTMAKNPKNKKESGPPTKGLANTHSEDHRPQKQTAPSQTAHARAPTQTHTHTLTHTMQRVPSA